MVATRVEDRAEVEPGIPVYICPGCGRPEKFGVKIAFHLTTQINGTIGKCRGIDLYPMADMPDTRAHVVGK